MASVENEECEKWKVRKIPCLVEGYRRIPIITAPLFSDLAVQRGRYFRVAVTFG